MKRLKELFGQAENKPKLKEINNEQVIAFCNWLRHIPPQWTADGTNLKRVLLNMCQNEHQIFHLEVKKMKEKEALDFLKERVWH